MIRFYSYSGGNNSSGLSPGWMFISYLYPNWILMLLDGLCLTGLGMLMGYLSYLGFSSELTLQAQLSGMMAIGLYLCLFGLIDIVYGSIKRKTNPGMQILVIRGWIQFVLSIPLLLLPGMILYMIFFILGLWALLTGCAMIFGARGARGVFHILVGIMLALGGCYLMFSVGTAGVGILYLVLSLLFFVFGLFIVVRSVSFRKAVKEAEKEARGFTDYTIE